MILIENKKLEWALMGHIEREAQSVPLIYPHPTDST